MGAGQEGLAATGGSDEEDVTLLQLHVGMVGGKGIGVVTADALNAQIAVMCGPIHRSPLIKQPPLYRP